MLVHASLSSIPLYFVSLFKILVGVARRIEKIMKYFLWFAGGACKRHHLISWEE